MKTKLRRNTEAGRARRSARAAASQIQNAAHGVARSAVVQRAALFLFLLVILNLQLPTLFAQGTAFTYQGRLSDGGRPANGLFTVRLNSNDEFDRTAFNGAPRWLEIGVRSNVVLGNFTVLSPRQSLDATPYAAFAFQRRQREHGAEWRREFGCPLRAFVAKDCEQQSPYS
jgi:hypothetical protein